MLVFASVSRCEESRSETGKLHVRENGDFQQFVMYSTGHLVLHECFYSTWRDLNLGSYLEHDKHPDEFKKQMAVSEALRNASSATEISN